MINPFFKNYGPLNIKNIYKILEIESDKNIENIKIFDIADLNSASNKDITFLHSNKYANQAANTNAAACITTQNLQHILQ